MSPPSTARILIGLRRGDEFEVIRRRVVDLRGTYSQLGKTVGIMRDELDAAWGQVPGLTASDDNIEFHVDFFEEAADAQP